MGTGNLRLVEDREVRGQQLVGVMIVRKTNSRRVIRVRMQMFSQTFSRCRIAPFSLRAPIKPDEELPLVWLRRVCVMRLSL
jgi:hypothetical protein